MRHSFSFPKASTAMLSLKLTENYDFMRYLTIASEANIWKSGFLKLSGLHGHEINDVTSTSYTNTLQKPQIIIQKNKSYTMTL
jgi:hypothetical protein